MAVYFTENRISWVYVQSLGCCHDRFAAGHGSYAGWTLPALTGIDWKLSIYPRQCCFHCLGLLDFKPDQGMVFYRSDSGINM